MKNSYSVENNNLASASEAKKSFVLEPLQRPFRIDLLDSREKIDNLSTLPYYTAYAEAQELQDKLAAFASISDAEELAGMIASRLFAQLQHSPAFSGDFSAKEIENLLIESGSCHDLLDLTHKLRSLLSSAEKDARYIYDPMDDKSILYVGAELHQLLRIARNLGLISFEHLRALQELKIAVLGASAVAPSIQLLANLGAGTGKNGWLRIADAGTMKVNSTGKFDASVFDIGASKVESLHRMLYANQPYGNFEAYEKNIPISRSEEFEAFVQDADIVVEVIDDPVAKSQLKLILNSREGVRPHIVRMADSGVNPFVSFESASGQVDFAFGKQLAPEELQFLAQFSQSPPDVQQQLLPVAHAVIASRYIAETPEHAVSFLVNPTTLSQTPIASRAAAVTLATEILRSIEEGFSDRGVSSSHSVRTLKRVSESDKKLLAQIFSTITGGVTQFSFS